MIRRSYICSASSIELFLLSSGIGIFGSLAVHGLACCFKTDRLIQDRWALLRPILRYLRCVGLEAGTWGGWEAERGDVGLTTMWCIF